MYLLIDFSINLIIFDDIFLHSKRYNVPEDLSSYSKTLEVIMDCYEWMIST